MEPEGSEKGPSHIIVLVQNRAGYLNLSTLLSRGWVENAQRGHAWIKWAWLAECHEGLIVLSGAEGGSLGQALLSGDSVRARVLAARFRVTGSATASTWKCNAQRHGRQRSASVAPPSSWRRRWACRSSPRMAFSSSAPTITKRTTRGVCVA